MGKNEHADLTALVVEAYEVATGEAPTPVEYGEIEAVTRDYLNEENRK